MSLTTENSDSIVEMENRKCIKCSAPIDYMALYLASKGLVDAVDNGTKEDLTQEEDDIYSEFVCSDCAREYLLTKV